ncbi:hypothetical protein NDU88_001287 [Pleurodeles waltl]|uniref:Uncharacterized protein n=1 Tax=Pleurodeles waltl TaxID=8319 RepID=A0AAV7U7Z7_PLEWA|nr:hypothetical protein NDU88_001287 [Pleurodeles waltl]
MTSIRCLNTVLSYDFISIPQVFLIHKTGAISYTSSDLIRGMFPPACRHIDFLVLRPGSWLLRKAGRSVRLGGAEMQAKLARGMKARLAGGFAARSEA